MAHKFNLTFLGERTLARSHRSRVAFQIQRNWTIRTPGALRNVPSNTWVSSQVRLCGKSPSTRYSSVHAPTVASKISDLPRLLSRGEMSTADCGRWWYRVRCG